MWFYKFSVFTTSIFVNFFWLEKVKGKKNIPLKGGVIIAPNHQSWIDPFFIMTAVKRRRFYFLIGDFVYKYKVPRYVLNKMEHIPVDRYSHDKKQVYEDAKRVLGGGGALVVFPEGRLTRNGYTQKAYKGVAKMALLNKVDIIPTVIENAYHVHPVHKKIPKFWGRRNCRVTFLEPIKYQAIKDLDIEHIVHDKIMKSIADKLGHDYNHSGFEKDIKIKTKN